MVWLSVVSAAWANGQVSHHWISRHAIEHLPEGELRELMSDPAMEPYFINGTSFPDGGYAVDHAYGEACHWEPLQDAYRDWLIAEFDDLSGDDAAPYVAFYLGLASHGMADQVYDSLYMARSKVYEPDAWAASDAFDQATDIVFASLVDSPEAPEPWFPEVMPQVIGTRGIEVDADTLDDGQNLVLLANDLVAALGDSPQAVENQAALFPWAAENMVDHAIPGDPSCESELVALYWQALWADLQTGWGPLEVLDTLPTQSEPYGHETDAGLPESWFTLVFSRGMVNEELGPEDFLVTDADGNALEVSVHLFYGTDSHVVHLKPAQDWPEGWITVQVPEGLTAQDGRRLEEPVSYTFTSEPPPEPSDPVTHPGCITTSRSASWAGLTGILLALGALLRRRR